MPLPDLVKILKKNISKVQNNANLNGIFVLKGGNINAEILPFQNKVELTEINTWFKDDWFENKYVIYFCHVRNKEIYG